MYRHENLVIWNIRQMCVLNKYQRFLQSTKGAGHLYWDLPMQANTNIGLCPIRTVAKVFMNPGQVPTQSIGPKVKRPNRKANTDLAP